MTTSLLTLRRRLSAVLLLASATTFGFGGCGADLPYGFDGLGSVVSVTESFIPSAFDEYVVYEEPYFIDDYVYEEPYYDDGGFGFDFGFESF